MKEFLIDHIDPLGQGVFKEEDQVYFIPKTLPGESGEFEITKSAKGVHFGKLQNIKTESPKRSPSECKHYDECNGCHYLHTDYKSEQEFKLETFKRMLKILENKSEIKIISNNERFDYRNRVQFHYHKKKKLFGFKQKNSNHILAISNCMIACTEIQNEIQTFTKNNEWLNRAPPKSAASGHVEFYFDGKKVHKSWNKPYAALGFSQVNIEVNQLLLSEIEKIYSNRNLNILDLFGGGGNLVNHLSLASKKSVDLYPNLLPGKQFYHLDLYQESALKTFVAANKNEFDTLFVDPPRSGFSKLKAWVEQYQFNQIFYLSCHPSTMVRDLRSIMDDYEIDFVYLVDFFPGTYHFEAAVSLKKKVN